MVYTTKGFTDNSPIPSSQYMTVKKTSTRKTRSQFLDTLDIKTKTSVRSFLLLNKSERQPEMAVFCGTVFKRGEEIQK